MASAPVAAPAPVTGIVAPQASPAVNPFSLAAVSPLNPAATNVAIDPTVAYVMSLLGAHDAGGTSETGAGGKSGGTSETGGTGTEASAPGGGGTLA